MTRTIVLLATLLAVALPAGVSAQTLGTFRWQLQPYCNVLTVTITQVGSTYRVEGTDDHCGGGRDQAAVQGMAFANPDGTIGFGLTTVTTPGGVAVHVDADMSIATASGTWRDSTGATGTFAFTPGAGSGGAPRPPATAAVPTAIRLLTDGGLLAGGGLNLGTIPAAGSGTRMMWYPRKAAFRAGSVTALQWDDTNVGVHSVAFGSDTIAAGSNSTALGQDARAIGAGSLAAGGATAAQGVFSVAMGYATAASGFASTALGSFTTASGDSSLAGGRSSSATATEAFAFGLSASAGGDGSVALGSNARTTSNAVGSLVFADRSTTAAFTSNAPNEVGVRAAGGVYLYTNSGLTTGVALAANGSSWAALSDVNAKENFREVDGEDVLAKLARVPIREWNYKAQDAATRHMGPTAQDFGAAFGLGDFPLRINTIDADGVALAGVQALEARTRALQAENETLRRDHAALSDVLDELRRQVAALMARDQTARGAASKEN
ncbi:MAG: tail fiber domain-containing protein [Acidobacteria bacterium]|nr:tail fiber domain-containing protein [Acidobacteriota bacterium]